MRLNREAIAFTAFMLVMAAIVCSLIGVAVYAAIDASRYRDEWMRNMRMARDMYLTDCDRRGALLKECANDWDRSVTLRTIYREKVSTLRSVDLPREHGFQPNLNR